MDVASIFDDEAPAFPRSADDGCPSGGPKRSARADERPSYARPPRSCDGVLLHLRSGKVMWMPSITPTRCGCKPCRRKVAADRGARYGEHDGVLRALGDPEALAGGGLHLYVTLDDAHPTVEAATNADLRALRKLGVEAAREALQEPGANVCAIFHPSGSVPGHAHPHFHFLLSGPHMAAGETAEIKRRLAGAWRRRVADYFERADVPALHVGVRRFDARSWPYVVRHELRSWPGWAHALHVAYFGAWRKTSKPVREDTFNPLAIVTPEEHLHVKLFPYEKTAREILWSDPEAVVTKADAFDPPAPPRATVVDADAASGASVTTGPDGVHIRGFDLSGVRPWIPAEVRISGIALAHARPLFLALWHLAKQPRGIRLRVTEAAAARLLQRAATAPSARIVADGLMAALRSVREDRTVYVLGEPEIRGELREIPLLGPGLLGAAEIGFLIAREAAAEAARVADFFS